MTLFVFRFELIDLLNLLLNSSYLVHIDIVLYKYAFFNSFISGRSSSIRRFLFVFVAVVQLIK